MNKRRIGNSGLEVSELGFGAMGLSFPNAPTKEESITLIRLAVEQSITFFDTAQAYGSNGKDVDLLFKKTVQHFGKVDNVINNAGIMITKFLKDFTEEEFDKQFSINVKSVFLMMKKASEILEKNGRIINISSSTSKLMMPTYTIYSATKSAVEQMTKVLLKK